MKETLRNIWIICVSMMEYSEKDTSRIVIPPPISWPEESQEIPF